MSTSITADQHGETLTKSHSDSDSITLKKDAQGRMAWEIKYYTSFSEPGGVLEATKTVERVHKMLLAQYSEV
jgi:hypothetical protein